MKKTKLTPNFIYKCYSKIPVWHRARVEKILICIKAPDQIYRILNPAISIFRWCVFFFWLPFGNGCRFNRIVEHNGVWNLLNGKPGRVLRKRLSHYLLFRVTFFVVQVKEESTKTDTRSLFFSFFWRSHLRLMCVSAWSLAIASFSCLFVSCV